jgi:hypothetical protein
MIKNDAALGKNRTGIALSPIDKKAMLEVTQLTVPPPGDEHDLADARTEYIEESEAIGTVPLPASMKGIATTGLAAIKGVNAPVLIDKLGERLAFERTGTRLYGALIDKCAAGPALEGGPTVEDLTHIQSEEHAHFELLREAIVALGGDPTAVTPSADIAGVSSMGLLQVITDARTTLKQSLEAILVAELADNDGWTLLIELVSASGNDELAEKFERAALTEAEHVGKVREWVTNATLAAARPSAKA